MKSIKFNLIMNMLLTLSSILFPVITFPYISRVLQAEGVGKITFLTSIVTYFVMFAQLGIPTYGIRACARVRDDIDKLSKTVQEIFLINLIMTLISYALLLIFLFNVDRLSEDLSLFLILSSMVLLNVFGMEWLYKALEEYKYITIRSIFLKFIAIIMMLLLVKDKGDYVIYGGISIFASSASNILNFINIRKYISFFKISKPYNIKQHIKPILVLFALTGVAAIYTSLDTVMLGFFHDNSAVGYFNVSVRVRTILLSLVTSIGAVLLPRLSYYVEKGESEKFLELSRNAFQFIMVFATAITVYFILYSKEVVYFLAGNGYNESVLPMQLMLPTVVLIGLTNLFGMQILLPLGKEKLVVYSVILGAIVSFTLNYFLIPSFSYLGTAFASLISELIVLIVQVYFIKDIFKDIIEDFNYFLVILVLPLASFASLFSYKLTNSNFLILVVSSMIFFVVYYIILRLLKNKFILYIEHQILNIIRR